MPKAKKTADATFEEGQRVEIDMGDGNTSEGIVTKVGKKSCDVETDDNEVLECEFSELTLIPDKEPEPEPPKKGKGKPAKDEPEPKQKSAKSSGTRSLMAAFNSRKPAANTMGLPIGSHECLVAGGEAAENDKGTNVYIEYVLVNADDDDMNGKSQRKYFQLVDSDGEGLQGADYFKKDLIDLGLEEEDFENRPEEEDLIDFLNGILKKLGKMQPYVSVKVVEGKGGYTNLYLNGLMEDQDNKPDMPDNFGA